MFAVNESGEDSGALVKIARLAHALDAEIELFQCIFDPAIVRRGRSGMTGVQQDIRESVERSQERLQTMAKPLRANGLTVRTAVRWDEPFHEGAIREVMRHKPDLLVTESISRSRIARLVLTQKDYRLIEACPCPLLLVKSVREYGKGGIVAAVDPTRAHGKPSDLDPLVLETASALANCLGAKMHVFHACVPWPQVKDDTRELRRIPARVEPEIHELYLKCTGSRILDLAGQHGVPRARIHVAEGELAESLPGLMKSLAADIIVMGAVSRSRLKRAFIGHSAERVLDALDADLLIVKPGSFRSTVTTKSIHRLPRGKERRARYVF